MVAILSSMSSAVTAIVGRVGFALPMPARMIPDFDRTSTDPLTNRWQLSPITEVG